MVNKKAEISTTTFILIIVGIVAIGTIGLLLYKYFSTDNYEFSNVTKADGNATSIIRAPINSSAPSITYGTNLTINVTKNENVTKSQEVVYTLYPDKTLTPGKVDTFDTSIICKKNYTDDGNISVEMQTKVMTRYGLMPGHEGIKIDYLIPLSLGGSNSIENMWPQLIQKPGYYEKNVLEKYYYYQVCGNSTHNGTMDIKQANAILVNNWLQGFVDAYKSGGIKSLIDNGK